MSLSAEPNYGAPFVPLAISRIGPVYFVCYSGGGHANRIWCLVNSFKHFVIEDAPLAWRACDGPNQVSCRYLNVDFFILSNCTQFPDILSFIYIVNNGEEATCADRKCKFAFLSCCLRNLLVLGKLREN